MSLDPARDPRAHNLTSNDPELSHRRLRLRQLGLSTEPDPQFDDYARRIAEDVRSLTGASHMPYGFVNVVTDEQDFVGLYAGDQGPAAPALAGDAAKPRPGRKMPLDHGFCPHVVKRRLALALGDVCDYPRFAGNPVIDALGVRTYLGAPLIDHTGVVLGTVCVVDVEPRTWGRQGIELIKDHASDLMKLIGQRDLGALDQTSGEGQPGQGRSFR